MYKFHILWQLGLLLLAIMGIFKASNLYFMKLNLLSKTALLVSFAVSTVTFSQEVIVGSEAEAIFPNVQMIRTGKHSTAPSYVRFYQGKELDLDGFEAWTKKNFRMDATMGFKLIGTETDQLGHKHYRYRQTYNGVPVECANWIVHTKNDKVYSMNGLIYPELNGSVNPGLSESAALDYAIAFMDADVYKWELQVEEDHLKREQNDPNATYYPSGEIVLMSQEAVFTPASYKLAYKFNIYAHQPVARAEVFVDAFTGEILFENEVFHHIDVPGTAQTAYSGPQSIVADSFGGSYRLRETGRGNGINTYDMNEGTNYGNAVDFTDDDNFWNNANPQLDEYATDAHWGAEMTYDYFWLEHNRNSIDDNGFALNSYVHYDNNYANAFWDGQRMTYGDGNGTTWDPLTAIDITGHEVTHGLTTFTAGLIYSYESGALNESFSDIFGTCIEEYALPSNWDWLIGEDIGSALRSMSNPNAAGDPDTYLGTNWHTAPSDNGGVHTNSGVQNFWFYLLTEGGTGTNDNADNYTVNGLGITEASQIAFRNLTVYLNQNSDYAEARFYAIQSAIDLFGECTPQVEACTNAWYAVGVGPEYVSYVIADMVAPLNTGCSAPFMIDFTNLSVNGMTFEWDFGDGNTSTDLAPTHTYTSAGLYTITLIADGGLCGADTTVWTDYVDVDPANPCIIQMPSGGSGAVQTGCNGLLYDSGGPSDDYGANEDAQITISPTGAVTVDITWNFFDIEAGQSGSCNYDYLEVYDGPNTASPLVDTYCNNNVPSGTWTSTGSSVTIVFHSDPGVEDAGYEIAWDCNLSTVAPTAGFISNTDTTCNGEVNFTDLSTNGPDSWLWDFGDGNTSTAQHPSHDYSASGLYTVTLTASNINGSDVATYVDYIYVDLPTPPTVTDDNICDGNTANLTATGSGGNLYWYTQQTGGTLVNTGTSYTTPVLGATTSYWVEEDIPGLTQNLGPADNSFGGGGFFNGNQHLIFDVSSPVTLKTVKVYANGGGNRDIELRDQFGTVVQSATIFIPDGEQVITLNFDLDVGTNWQLGTAPNSNQDLFRNNANANYPYIVGGGEVTIVEASPNPPNNTIYYYYFYDWEIESSSCTSERVEVTANVTPNSDATIDPVSPMCSSDAAITLTAAETGGTWSGTGVSGDQFDPSTAGNGTHTITYTIGGACGDTDQIDIVVADSYDATITPTSLMCTGDAPVTLTAVDGGGTWSGTGITNSSTGEFDPSIAGVGTHTITYDITGSCGDTDTEDIIVEATPDATVNPAGPFCVYEAPHTMVPVTTGGTWSADCGACVDAGTGEFNPNVAGLGLWTITYSFGGNCPATYDIAVSVLECLGIADEGNLISIYPNPSNGSFIIAFENTMEMTIQIRDISGRIVYNQFHAQSEKVEIDLQDRLADGTYFISILDANAEIVHTQKIQVIR